MIAGRPAVPPTRREIRAAERTRQAAAEEAATRAAAELAIDQAAEVAAHRAALVAGPVAPTVTRREFQGARRQAEKAAVQAVVRTRRKFRSVAAAALAIVVVPATLVVGSAVAEQRAGNATELAAGQSATKDSGKSLTDGTASVAFQLGGRPAGNSLYLGLELRRAGANFYRTKVRVNPDGAVLAGISKVVNGQELGLGTVKLPVTVPAGASTLNVQGYVSGKAPATKLAVRAWVQGTALPTYQLIKTDQTQVSGSGTVRSWAYLSALATANAKVTAGAVTVTAANAAPAPTTPAPTKPATPSPTKPAEPAPTKPATPAPTKPAEPAPGGGSSGGGGKPDAGNTGVPKGVTLKQHYGDMKITKDGTTLDKMDIHGFVIVTAKNVKITNSIVRGGKATGNLGLVTVYEPAQNFVIEDSTLVPEFPSVWLDNLKGSEFTARRINAYGGVDAVKVHGNNVLVEDSFLHGNAWYANDPNQGNTETHNDGVEIVGGNNITFRDNTIEGGNNAGLQVTQDYRRTTNLSFTGNWVSGGDCTLNFASKGKGGGGSGMGPIPVRDNVFGPNLHRTGACAITKSAATTLQMSGNSWASTSPNARAAVVARTAG